MTEEDQNLQSLFANLNQVSRNTMIREKSGGGTGGGSDIVEGSMDPNALMTGSPYIAKNVVEFNQGGMVGSSGAPTINNPYLEKINQLVGLQQMMNVTKGLANNVLQQEAMAKAHGMSADQMSDMLMKQGDLKAFSTARKITPAKAITEPLFRE